MKEFLESATKLARNPLGIVALLITLVYAIAGIASTSSVFTSDERTLLVYFLIFFPVLVLIAVYRFVTAHNDKLYAPSDFSNEDHFMTLVESQIKKSPTIGAIENELVALRELEDSNTHLFRGYYTMRQGNPQLAVEYYDQAISIYPKNKEAHLQKGYALKKIGDIEQAFACADTAVDINDTYEAALYNRACYRCLLGHPDELILQDLERAIKLNTENKRFAREDKDFDSIKSNLAFKRMTL